jgi:hypothetical protein
MKMRTTKYTKHTKGPGWKRFFTEGRNLMPALNWWLEPTIGGTLVRVPPHCGGRHLCLPVSTASSRVVPLPQLLFLFLFVWFVHFVV